METNSLMTKQPKILLWDIETSLIVGTFFQLKNDYLPHNGILQDWNIYCGCWKWLDKDKIYSTRVGKDVTNDREVCEILREVVAEADIVVHHNGDSFDIKKLNSRLIFHGLTPLPPKATVDTKKEAKKIAYFTSNRLDYLDKHLGGPGKIHTEPDLWMDVLRGDMDALDSMVEYNKGDILALERVYLKLRNYLPTHPHVGVMKGEDRKTSCPKCGGNHLVKDGVRITASGIRQQALKCNDCGGYSRVPFTPIGTI